MIPIRSKITEAMRRPDCIMGVTGDGGGSWLSPITADGAQPTTLPAAAGQPWAIGSGILKNYGLDSLFEFHGVANASCGSALDMQGYGGDFSFFVDCEIDTPPSSQSGAWYLPFLCQGLLTSYLGYSTGFAFRKASATANWQIYGAVSSGSGQVYSVYALTPTEAVGRHHIALVRDATAGTLSCYWRGIKRHTATNTIVSSPLNPAIRSGYGAERGIAIGAGATTGVLYPGTYRVHAAAVFNRALSAEEIAYLS